ncbi:hypothetical protein EXE43_09620 [Halorubrum sp. SS5]|nr:hypothetical protein EXE43_09620 [Halorubrum sp. SS5]
MNDPSGHEDELPDEWQGTPKDPPEPEERRARTMEHRPGGRDGQEVREVSTGAWIASDVVVPLTDAVQVSK